LNDIPVRIGKVKGIAAVAMLLRQFHDPPAQLRQTRFDFPIHPVDCLGALKDHADVIQQLPRQGLIRCELGRWDLV
jgi:hypothetical protein